MTNRPARWTERHRARRAERLAVFVDELERRLPRRYARSGPRRALAGAGGALLGLLWVDAAVSWVLAPSDTAMIANFVILGVLVLAGLPLAGRLIGLTRGVTAMREGDLDERQLTARLRAFATAHRATTYLILAVLLVTSFVDAGEGREARVPMAAYFLTVFALLVTHALLPLVVAAWQMPDPPDDEDDEDHEDHEDDDSGDDD